jgi:hypothetical protein
LVFSAISSTAEARIGERRDSIERRLFSSGGIMYRDDAVEASRSRGMPYVPFFDYLSSSADVRIYFKTADGRRPSSKDLEGKRVLPGWDLHVVYVGGKSVMEVYKRSQGVSKYELNQLLVLNANGSFWKKIEKPKPGEKAKPSALGCDMETDNGQIRAKKLGGNGLIVVDAQLDELLADEKDADLVGKAPVSVSGF